MYVPVSFIKHNGEPEEVQHVQCSSYRLSKGFNVQTWVGYERFKHTLSQNGRTSATEIKAQ